MTVCQFIACSLIVLEVKCFGDEQAICKVLVQCIHHGVAIKLHHPWLITFACSTYSNTFMQGEAVVIFIEGTCCLRYIGTRRKCLRIDQEIPPSSTRLCRCSNYLRQLAHTAHKHPSSLQVTVL